jgi:hypothetical protein
VLANENEKRKEEILKALMTYIMRVRHARIIISTSILATDGTPLSPSPKTIPMATSMFPILSE